VLLQGGQHLGVGGGGLGRPAQRRLPLGPRAEPQVEVARHEVGGGEVGVGGQGRLELLERLAILALVGVDARQQHAGARVLRVGLDALLQTTIASMKRPAAR
jgi:hypothetical protein